MSEQNAFLQEQIKHQKEKFEELLMKTNSKLTKIFQIKQDQQQEQQKQNGLQIRRSGRFKVKTQKFNELKQQFQNKFLQKPQITINEVSQDVIQMQTQQKEVEEEQLNDGIQIQEHIIQGSFQTISICSACNQPQEQNHQCDGDFGFILCPYCGDNIVRNFMKDHQDECIPYLESQFQSFDQFVECCICSESITSNKVVLECDHCYHSECINQWRQKKNECPICRKLF